MYQIQKLCIIFGSILKEGLYDHGFLSRSRFKTHTVMEDEISILVRVVLMAEVHSSNVISYMIMSNINASLQSFEQWIKCS